MFCVCWVRRFAGSFLRVFAVPFCWVVGYTVCVGSGGVGFLRWLAGWPFGFFFFFLLGVFVVSVRFRSSVVSSSLRSSVLLLPGFAWSPAGGRVGSRGRRWVPVWSPALLPSRPRPVVAAPVLPAASSSGSLLFLSSPVFLSAVSSGRCPVSVALSVFPRWPLRSAVLGALVRCLASPRVRSFLCSAVGRPVVRSFLRAGLRSLGFSVSGRFLGCPSRAASFLASFRVGVAVASVPPFRPVGVSSFALVRALSSLSRCLGWLFRRGSFCPPALRGLVAGLCWLLLPLA